MLTGGGTSTHGPLEHIRRDIDKVMRAQEDMKSSQINMHSQMAELRSGQDQIRDILLDLVQNYFGRPAQPNVSRVTSPFDDQKSAGGSSMALPDVTPSPSLPVVEASKTAKVTFQSEVNTHERPAGRKQTLTRSVNSLAGGAPRGFFGGAADEEEEEGSESDEEYDPTTSKSLTRRRKKTEVHLHESWENSKIPNRRYVALGFNIFASSVHEDFNVSSTGKLGRSGAGPRPAQLVVKEFRRAFGRIPGWRNFKMDRLVMSPSSSFSLFWTMLEGLLLISDFIMIPMLMFDDTDDDAVVVPRGSPWSHISLWQRRISIVFWSIDFPLSFFKGFIDKKGERVVRLPKVAFRYLIGGAPLDVPLLCIEYVTFFLADTFSEGRLLRVLRYSRSLKAGKLRRLTRRLVSRVKRPEGLAAMQMVGHLFAVILMCHVFACLWYGIGMYFDVGGPQWTSIFTQDDVFQVEVDSHAFRYFTSLRWALAQLGFGDSQIYPQNWLENVFATLFSVICVIVMTHLMGLIITSMIRLQDGQRDALIQQSQMREYLRQHDVSFDLQDRIWQVLKQLNVEGNHRTTEDTVDLIKELPNSLEMELRAEVFVKPLTNHPFFGVYGVSGADPHAMYNIIRKRAVVVTLVESKQELFSEHESGTAMWFVQQGSLSYRFRHEPREVHEKQWIAEATLWLQWKYVGTATAKTSCDLIELAGDAFREIVQADLPQAQKYAKAFYNCAVKMGRLFNECEPSKDSAYMMAQDVFNPAKAFILSDCQPIVKRRLDEWKIAQQTASEDWQTAWTSPWSDSHALSTSAIIATLVTEMKRDIIMIYQTLFSQNLADKPLYEWPSDLEKEQYEKRILFLKRLIVMLGMCQVGCSDEDNSTQRQLWALPLASILCHGGRSMVRLHGVHPREVINFLALGDKDGNNWSNGPPGPLYSRLAASHGVKADASGMLHEVKLKGVAGATGRGHNLGLDLPVGGLGNPAPRHSAGNMFVGPAGVPYKVQGQNCVLVKEYQHGHMYVRWDDFGTKNLKYLSMEGDQPAASPLGSPTPNPGSSAAIGADSFAHSSTSGSFSRGGDEGQSVDTLRTSYIWELAVAARRGSHSVDENHADPSQFHSEHSHQSDTKSINSNLYGGRLSKTIETAEDLEQFLPDSHKFESNEVRSEHLFKYTVDRNELTLMQDENGLVVGCHGVMVHLTIELEGAAGEDLVLCHLGAAPPDSSGVVVVQKTDTKVQARDRAALSRDFQRASSSQSISVGSISVGRGSVVRGAGRPVSPAPAPSTSSTTLQNIIEDNRVVSVLCNFDGLWLPTLMQYVQTSFQLSDAAMEKIYQGLSDEVWLGESDPSPTINHHHVHACSALDLTYHAVYLKSRIYFKDISVLEKLISPLGSSRISDDMVFTCGLGEMDSDDQHDTMMMGMTGIKREWAWIPKSEAEEIGCSDMYPPAGAIKLRLENKDVQLGSLMMGIENSAPLKDDLFGGTHNTSAKSKDTSAFGKRKWRDYRKNGRVAGSSPSPVVLRLPADFGGVQLFMNKAKFTEFMRVCNKLAFASPSAASSSGQEPREEEEFFQRLLCADARQAEEIITQYASGNGLPPTSGAKLSARSTEPE